MITINGVTKEEYTQLPLNELLEQEGYEISKIAVEINGEIIPKTTYSETLVQDKDCIEVVSFVGGG